MLRHLAGVFLVLACLSPAVRAGEQILKHDQFNADIATAASQVQGTPLAAQPGWVEGEAIGQMYRPAAWPVKILGVHMILAAPPNAPNLTTHAWLEFYFSTGDGPDPGKTTPDWKIHTSELLDPGTLSFGYDLKGNTALLVDFDWNDAEGHPPIVTEGNIWFVVRFDEPSSEMTEEWGTLQCATLGGFGCGCQKVGGLHDQSSTPKANVMHYISPAGTCGGTANKWEFMEKVGVTGDLLMRLKVDAPEATCVPACGGKACGPDGCGGSCGTCAGGQSCVGGVCEGGTCTPSCAGMVCGDDGCGGSCGTCGAGQVCAAGACSNTCVPSCAGIVCGTDGCGGSCGGCGTGEVCDAGACVEDTDPPKPGAVGIQAISPDFGFGDRETPVTITGTGFQPGATVKVGAAALGSVRVTGGTVIEATVPKDLAPGKYMVLVINPDDTSGFLDKGFEVRGSPCGDGTCSAAGGETCDTCAVDCGVCDVGGGGASSDGCSGGHPGVVWLWLLIPAFASFTFGRRRRTS